MKKMKTIAKISESLHAVMLEDFSHFEAKMTKIKHLKAVKQNLDKSFFSAAIDALALEGKKITAKRVKRICKKALMNMTEEVE